MNSMAQKTVKKLWNKADEKWGHRKVLSLSAYACFALNVQHRVSNEVKSFALTCCLNGNSDYTANAKKAVITASTCMRRYIIKPVLRIRDNLIFTHPGSRISDLGSKNSNKREGWKKKLSYLLLEPQISQNVKLFYFWNVEEKIWANSQRIIELFAQKLFLSPPKTMGLGSGIRKKPIPDPGVKRHRIPDPQHYYQWTIKLN